MIIALDIGLKRIGVAISPDSKIALPSEPIMRKNRKDAAQKTSQMLKEKSAQKLIIGIPKGGSSEAEMRCRIEHFTSLLDFGGEIIYIDEAFSSVEASEFIAGKNAKSGKLDSIAASIILQRYLDGQKQL